LYTISPQEYSLNDIITGAETQIIADLFEGNSEDGGKLLSSQIEFKIVDRIFANHLSIETPQTADVFYYYINKGGIVWLEHVIADNHDDYDQIILVQVTPKPLEIPLGSQDVIIQIFGVLNNVNQRQ